MSLIFGFWKFLKCILNQNSYFWGGVCFMNFLIWGFLNDFINSSGIIFEFHYNFIIFFCVWVPRFYTKNFNFFLPPIPPKKWLFWQNLAILALFGTFWIFFDHLYPPKKTKKILYWHNFAILALFSTFLGGVKIAQKKIMLFKYSPLVTQNSKNFYTHSYLIISQIILTGTGLSYQRVLEISCIYCLGQNSKIFQDWNLQKVMQ